MMRTKTKFTLASFVDTPRGGKKLVFFKKIRITYVLVPNVEWWSPSSVSTRWHVLRKEEV